MEKIIYLIIIFFVGCIEYPQYFEPISVPNKFVYGEKEISLKEDNCYLVMPIWTVFPYFYLNNISAKSVEINQCFLANDKSLIIPNFNVNILQGGFFSIGNKKVPSGCLLWFKSGELLYCDNYENKATIGMIILKNNKEFLVNFLSFLKSKNNIIDFSLEENYLFFKQISFGCGRMIFNLNEKERKLLIDYLELQ